MDDRVIKAMAQWPDVPAAYGWLSLDARGHWHLKGEAITNLKLIDFIQRNYLRAEDGSYVFQNGPQRVYVDLELLPFVARWIEDAEPALDIQDHCGNSLLPLRSAHLDSRGRVILCGEQGPALLSDHDLPHLLDSLRDEQGRNLNDESLDACLTQLSEAASHQASAARGELYLDLPQGLLPLLPIREDALAEQFGIIAHPQAPEAG